MAFCITLSLFGPAESRQKAKGLLESIPQVKQADADPDLFRIRLLAQAPVDEGCLLPLLAQSGIYSFCIDMD